jgi:flagellin-like protein
MKKKAISPLISTVLLVAFAVALGALVMNWGKIYTQQQMEYTSTKSNEELECELNVELALKEISGEPQIFYYNASGIKNLTFTIENQGRKDIDSLRVIVIGQNGNDINTTELPDSKIVAGGTFKGSVGYTNSTISEVKIIPKLNTTGSTAPTLCTRNTLTIDSINIVN